MFNIAGYSKGYGTVTTIFYQGVLKPYQKWYKNELKTTPDFLNREFDKFTNPWPSGPK